MALVEVHNAGFAYGQQTVLRDVSLELAAGEVLCLAGPNGCGKTTLLDGVIGALRPAAGTIRLGGRDIRSLKPPAIARTVAYVPQLHERTFPFTVLEIVLMGRSAYTGLFAAPGAADVAAAEAALAAVGLNRYRDRPYTRLSGGECQLVLLARALAQEAPVLVLDEPTAHLDFNNEMIFLATITRLVRETGVAVLMATHFPNHAFTLQNSGIPTRVALMYAQGMACLGAPEVVLTEDNLNAVFRVDARVLSYQQAEQVYNYILPLGTVN